MLEIRLSRVLEISKVFVCILICMYIMLCSIISVRQQPNVALYVIRANKDVLYCIVLYHNTSVADPGCGWLDDK